MQNLGKLRRLNLRYFLNKVKFISVLTPPYNLLPRVDYFSKICLGRQNVLIDPVNTWGSSLFRDFKKENSLYYKSLAKIERRVKQSLIENKQEGLGILLNIFQENLLKITRLKPAKLGREIQANGICIPGVSPFVSPEGKIYICQKIDYNLCIGDIYKGYNLRKTFKIISDYIRLSEKDCLACWYCRFCGACFIHATGNNRLDYQRKSAFYCEPIKKLFLKNLIFYYRLLEKNPQLKTRLCRQLKKISDSQL